MICNVYRGIYAIWIEVGSPGSLAHSRDLTLQGLQPELELKIAKHA